MVLCNSFTSISPTPSSSPTAREKDQGEGLQWRVLISPGFRQTNGGIIVCFPRVIHSLGEERAVEDLFETNTRQPSSLSR